MADFTPGPWRVEHGTTCVWGGCDPDDHSDSGMGYPVTGARITPISLWAKGPWADEGEANARLIAAAPDMLAALRVALEVMENVDGENDCSRGIRSVEAAISKATGQ